MTRITHDATSGPKHPAHRELRVICQSDPLSVREALQTTLTGLAALWLSDDDASTVELVLAEVLNNVTEHAYVGVPDGRIELQVRQSRTGLHCTIIDDGAPMPETRLPLPRNPEPQRRADLLQEGGFGWFLIHELAHDLHYRRDGARNRLDFSLTLTRPIRGC